MGNTIEMIVRAWVEGVVSTAQVVISAIPAWGSMISTAYVTVTAIPYFVPGVAGAVVAFILLFGFDHILFEEDDW